MEQSIFAQLAMRPEYGCASLLAVAPFSCSGATFNSIFGAIPQTAASEQHKRRERQQHAGADSSVLAGSLRGLLE